MALAGSVGISGIPGIPPPLAYRPGKPDAPARLRKGASADRVYYHRAFAAAKAGNLLPAIEGFQQSIRLNPDADAYNNLGATFFAAGEFGKALDAFLMAVKINAKLASAYYGVGYTLGALGRNGEAVAVYDEVLARFAPADEGPLHELVAKALVNKGLALRALGRNGEAVAVCDDVLARFAAAEEMPLRESVTAKALVNKGGALGALGRSGDAIAVYDDVLTRFAAAEEMPLRELVAMALVNKGITLGALGRHEDAIAVYDDVLTRFTAADERPLRELVAKALLNKGFTLGMLGGYEEEIAAYDYLLAQFANADGLPLRASVAMAHLNKGAALGALGRSGDALAAYNDLLAQFAEADELPLREQVAMALVNKGITLGALGRNGEAVGVYDDVLAQFAEADELPLREQVAKAHFNKGITLGRGLNRFPEAIATLREADNLDSDDVTRSAIKLLIEEFESKKQVILADLPEHIDYDAPGIQDLSGTDMGEAAQLYAEARKLGFTFESALKTLQAAAEAARETTDHAKDEPRLETVTAELPTQPNQAADQAVDTDAALAKVKGDATLLRQWHKYQQLLTAVALPSDGQLFKTLEDAANASNLAKTYFRARARQATLGIELVPENESYIRQVASAATLSYQKLKPKPDAFVA